MCFGRSFSLSAALVIHPVPFFFEVGRVLVAEEVLRELLEQGLLPSPSLVDELPECLHWSTAACLASSAVHCPRRLRRRGRSSGCRLLCCLPGAVPIDVLLSDTAAAALARRPPWPSQSALSSAPPSSWKIFEVPAALLPAWCSRKTCFSQ